MLKLVERESRRTTKRNIVRNVRFSPTLDEAIITILSSGWDFTDVRHRLYGDPEYHRRYLDSLLHERAQSLEDLQPTRRTLFLAIIDAWLAWEQHQ